MLENECNRLSDYYLASRELLNYGYDSGFQSYSDAMQRESDTLAVLSGSEWYE